MDRKLKHNRIDLPLPAAIGGFGVWWDKTHREHAAMIAQLSALMGAPRQVDSQQARQLISFADLSLSSLAPSARPYGLRYELG